ncbi:MAG: OmpA family protein [Kiritimatiellae bacterium]|jgi:peptidoglycan-associated lipoprotein|nr:OmpA family protein [Kiritimatiellia bacterium]MBO7207599.1 OmpA family protein [Kiritimatiellia bacterium]
MKMKFATIAVVLAAAFCMAGCRYDKAGKGSGDASAGSAQDISTLDDASSMQQGTIGSASEGKFEDLYTRCTDVNFEPVYFGFDSTVVPQGELGKIDAVAQHLSSNADRVVVIEGNCDERGSNEYNMALGENRAIIVRNYLVQSGIAADRIQTRSYGEEKPAVVGQDESAWSQNRRGEFAIFQK